MPSAEASVARAPARAGSPRAQLRYAQCWEDADVLLQALEVRPGDVCVSIASGGDNALALLTADPARVIALDTNPSQIAALELRVAAYRSLEHGELLELIGSRPSARREVLYQRCRALLSPGAREFWDGHRVLVERGLGHTGTFERYLDTWRRRILPLVHDRATVGALFEPRPPEERVRFYETVWDNRRWRLMFRLSFSRFLLARLARHPDAFAFTDGDVAGHLLARARYAATVLDPVENPYLRWILTGRHGDVLPVALRPESFDTIRGNLDRLEWHHASVDEWLASPEVVPAHRFNLSDIFEYVSPASTERTLSAICDLAPPGARLAYWNMMVPRSRPPSLAERCVPRQDLSERLHAEDRAFFYSAFVVEEVA